MNSKQYGNWTDLCCKPIHAHIHTQTGGSTMQGDRQLVWSSEGEASRSGTPRYSGPSFSKVIQWDFGSRIGSNLGNGFLKAKEGFRTKIRSCFSKL